VSGGHELRRPAGGHLVESRRPAGGHSITVMRPKVTALMPVKSYHRRYLHEAVRSLPAQTCPDWQLLVIAERSGRGELEAQLGAHLSDPRIQLIVNEGRKLAGALNTGMRRATTEFVAILLGDDVWSACAVDVLGDNLTRSPGTDFFHSSRRVIDGAGRPISSVHHSRPNVSVGDFVRGSSPVKHLLCWRREMGLAVGGMDESLNSVGVDDFDFPWTMAEHGAKFTAIPDCLYVYRDHRESYRLTTHLPLSHHKREIARIMGKHGVGDSAIGEAIAQAERSYLRQCLYRSRLDRWTKALRGHPPREGWRERYR
jgi:glycosyltransferase involved in cell wall biosynthesis